jgi:hypothetical protein
LGHSGSCTGSFSTPPGRCRRDDGGLCDLVTAGPLAMLVRPSSTGIAPAATSPRSTSGAAAATNPCMPTTSMSFPVRRWRRVAAEGDYILFHFAQGPEVVKGSSLDTSDGTGARRWVVHRRDGDARTRTQIPGTVHGRRGVVPGEAHQVALAEGSLPKLHAVTRVRELRRSRELLRLYRHVGTPSARSPAVAYDARCHERPRGYSRRAEQA